MSGCSQSGAHDPTGRQAGTQELLRNAVQMPITPEAPASEVPSETEAESIFPEDEVSFVTRSLSDASSH